MARDIYAYREVAIQSVRDTATGSLRLRPMPGQAFSPTLPVHASRRLRDEYPEGTCFKVNAKLTDRLGGERYLYVHHGDPVQVLSPAEAARFLSEYRRGRI